MPIGYCAYLNVPIESTSDGVWDDGEWISWEYINQFIAPEPTDVVKHRPDPELLQIFESLIHTAAAYKELTGRYLDIFGELGEIHAEVHLGLRRHKPNAPGSDGRLGHDFVEVKTISPIKQNDQIRVKRRGNFNKLYVVRFSENFFYEARMIDRSELKKGDGKFARVRFRDMQTDETDEE